MFENHRIEYKRELNENFEKTVIGFLNSKEGGCIFIEIDKAGKTIGVSDPDGDQLKVKDRLKFNIRPSCLGLFDLLTEKKDGKQLIKVVIASGLEKPYHLRNYGMTEKGCFIRIG
jgi:tryptophanase